MFISSTHDISKCPLASEDMPCTSTPPPEEGIQAAGDDRWAGLVIGLLPLFYVSLAS